MEKLLNDTFSGTGEIRIDIPINQNIDPPVIYMMIKKEKQQIAANSYKSIANKSHNIIMIFDKIKNNSTTITISETISNQKIIITNIKIQVQDYFALRSIKSSVLLLGFTENGKVVGFIGEGNESIITITLSFL